MKKLLYIYILAITTVYGQQPITQELRIVDKTGMDISSIFTFQKKKESDSMMQQVLKKAENQLQKNGFFNYKIKVEIKDGVKYYVINLDRKITSIFLDTIHGDFEVFEEIPKVIKPNEIEDLLNKIVAKHNDNGYPFATAKLDNIKVIDNKIFADLNLEKGAFRRLDKFVVKGYDKFPLKIVEQSAGIKPPTTFNNQKIKKVDQVLDNLDFITKTKSSELLFTKDSTHLYMYVQPKKGNYADGVLGFATNDGKLNLTGKLDLTLMNIFHKGEVFTLNWDAAGGGSQQLEAKLKLPYIFQTPFSIGYHLSFFKRDSSYYNNNQNITLNYSLRHQKEIGLIWERNTSSNIQEIENKFKDFSSNFVGIHFSNSSLRKKIIGKSKFKVNTNFLMGSRTNETQVKLRNELTFLFHVTPRSIIEASNITESLWSKDIWENEKYLLGGIHDLRGFRKNIFNTDRYSVTQIDYHYMTSETDYFSLITDLGILKNNAEKELLPYSIGFGYHFNTKNGQIYVNYSLGNEMGNVFLFSNSQFHIGIKQVF